MLHLAIEGGIDPEHVNSYKLRSKDQILQSAEEEAVFDFAAEANILKNVTDAYLSITLVEYYWDENAAIDISRHMWLL